VKQFLLVFKKYILVLFWRWV